MSGRRPSISCVYCGGAHASADEVRQCWQRSAAEPSLFADTVTDTVTDADPWPDRSAPVAVAAARGPALLGRHVLVAPGQAAPDAWAGAPRLRVGHEALEPLRAHWLAGTGCVLEVDGPLDALLDGAFDAPLHELGPRHVLAGDLLHHVVTANSVDARDGMRFPLLDAAVALGASPVRDGRGDVALPGGSRAWLDGGPPRHLDPIDGVPVVHRITVEHGSLQPPSPNTSAAELAPDQYAAVTHPGGAARIIAPAGSGKTRVLTERARHLVARWHVPPSAVALVAFNKRAQEEMQARTSDVPGLQVRTLNAIALAVVNGSRPFARQPQQMATIDEPEVRRLIGRLVTFPRKRNADPVATWIEALAAARLGLADPVVVEARYDGEVAGFAEVLPRFRAQLARAGQVDYDEQVVRAIEILLTQPAARRAAQRACRWMLVDEFQDLTPAHVLLVRLLAGPDAAVFAVGDDDQTIYGYNGADPAWLLEFADLFPGAGDHPLEVNYRCPEGVVRAADTLLRHNRRRVQKVIRAASTGHDGFMVAPAEGDSVATTVQAVATAVAAGSPPAEIAVLTRVNSLLAPVQVALHGAGVPVNGGVGSEFLERTAVRAALAWLRLATADGRLAAADLAEAWRRPSRSAHPRVGDWVAEQDSVAGIRRLAERMRDEREQTTVLTFAGDIEHLQRLAATRGTTAALLARLRDQMGLASSIATLDRHRHGMNRAAQNDDLVALAQLAALQPDPTAFHGWLRQALAVRWQADGVTLATVHRVKGQEWPFVVVHHADADQFPHRLADDEEEERRLFHVAITRASRDVLVVPSDLPSPFILDCSTEPRPRPTRLATEPAASRAARPAAAAAKPGDGLSPADTALFEALRTLRRHLAAGKPAYTVLADRALHDIAVARPASLDALAAVKGVGPAKLQQYGAALLAAVEEHREK